MVLKMYRAFLQFVKPTFYAHNWLGGASSNYELDSDWNKAEKDDGFLAQVRDIIHRCNENANVNGFQEKMLKN